MSSTQHSLGIWRWLASAAVVINVFFNYYLIANPIQGQTMGDVSDKYPTLITPAGYAFSIWGLIYLLLILYAIYQLLPAQGNLQIYNRLARPLIATSLLSIAWLICFSLEYIGISVLVILGMLSTVILLFGWANEATFRNEASVWITIPFSLYLAWLSVATIVNIAVWLTDMGWRGGTPGETVWTLGMLGAVLAAGIVISKQFKDISYPAVIAWAVFAIYAARRGENEIVATTALVIGIILSLWVMGYGLWLFRSLYRKTSRSIRYGTGNSAWSYKNR